jgi:hypothetical protein|tara:strand:+ start:5458 stop:5565 length:108 start_codon:yes stop_codon:yes gene_type:complete
VLLLLQKNVPPPKTQQNTLDVLTRIYNNRASGGIE